MIRHGEPRQLKLEFPREVSERSGYEEEDKTVLDDVSDIPNRIIKRTMQYQVLMPTYGLIYSRITSHSASPQHTTSHVAKYTHPPLTPLTLSHSVHACIEYKISIASSLGT